MNQTTAQISVIPGDPLPSGEIPCEVLVSGVQEVPGLGPVLSGVPFDTCSAAELQVLFTDLGASRFRAEPFASTLTPTTPTELVAIVRAGESMAQRDVFPDEGTDAREMRRRLTLAREHLSSTRDRELDG